MNILGVDQFSKEFTTRSIFFCSSGSLQKIALPSPAEIYLPQRNEKKEAVEVILFVFLYRY